MIIINMYAPLKVSGPVEVISEEFTYDLSVPDTNSYTINVGGNEVISHNTVSLLAGCTPGVHFPIAKCYIRRVRISNSDDNLLKSLKNAGYHVEPCVGSEQTTSVVEFPIKLNNKIPTQDEVSVEFKLRLTAIMQEYWADNQVSATIDFDPNTEGDKLVGLLNEYMHKLKSISFLPRMKYTYAQMPYEPISVEKYNELIKDVKPVVYLDSKANKIEIERDVWCDSGKCEIVYK